MTFEGCGEEFDDFKQKNMKNCWKDLMWWRESDNVEVVWSFEVIVKAWDQLKVEKRWSSLRWHFWEKLRHLGEAFKLFKTLRSFQALDSWSKSWRPSLSWWNIRMSTTFHLEIKSARRLRIFRKKLQILRTSKMLLKVVEPQELLNHLSLSQLDMAQYFMTQDLNLNRPSAPLQPPIVNSF